MLISLNTLLQRYVCKIIYTGTPVLNRKMTLRRETLKALETRRNSVMAERRKSQMQTLGANNEYGVAGMVFTKLIYNYIDFSR